MANKKSQKLTDYTYTCMCCDYNTCSNKDYTKHLVTPKHKRLINANEFSQKIPNNIQEHICECGKCYKHMSSLCKHKKVCQLINGSTQYNFINKDNITPELIIELVKQNKELQQTLIDQNKTIMDLAEKAGNNYVNSNNNSNNKTFNLQIFLNETCKDAINLTDFVNQYATLKKQEN
jgi:hypothetical protein